MKRRTVFHIAVPLLALGLAALACQPGGGTKPTVTITAPPNNSQVAAGQTVEVMFHAEDAKAVLWVQLEVNGAVVAMQATPLPEGQTPFDGILRWTPSEVGTFDVILIAHSSGGLDSDPAAVSIQVVAANVTIDAPFVPSMSGSVDSTGRVLEAIFPGDDSVDNDYEGFITFDIGSLPGNATINSASLDLGPCTTRGNPAELGNLQITNLQYGTLDGDDYAAAVGASITSVTPCAPSAPAIDVTSFVQAVATEPYFQLRLYFAGPDYDGEIDDVAYTAPVLTITYTAP